MGRFPEREATELLARCHWRCCICHRFCGVKMELDHMQSSADGGPDTIDNAMPVCFECHAEIHAYNDRHPRGRKFTPEELRLHKERWLRLCETSAHFLASVPPRTDVGPIQALIDGLEFNATVAASADEIPHLTTSALLPLPAREDVILARLGHEQILLVGMPLSPANDFSKRRRAAMRHKWHAARAQIKAPWVTELKAKVRSMSGWTRDYFGGLE